MREGRGSIRGLTRREFLATSAGAGAGLLLLGGCGGGAGGGAGSGSGQLTFQTWASTSGEQKGFRGLVQRFEKENPDASIKLEIVPGAQQYTKLDTRLAAGEGPDLARMQYQAIGRYSSQGALVDLSEYLDGDEASVFTPAFWQAVQYEDTPYATTPTPSPSSTTPACSTSWASKFPRAWTRAGRGTNSYR